MNGANPVFKENLVSGQPNITNNALGSLLAILMKNKNLLTEIIQIN